LIAPGGTLVVATRNRGKTKEFREALAALGVVVRDLNETEGVPPIEETGETFAENALLKAQSAAEILGLPVLADDSGLCVDALGGAPGVYSARYAGEGAPDADNNAKLIRELRAVTESESLRDVGPGLLSSAKFVCSLALFVPGSGFHLAVEGAVDGFILNERRGDAGFGYDPYFWLPEFGKSMAEITVEQKNAISHRGRALRELLDKLRIEP
jgi:XTP/dITP diphosphohydrolase